MSTKPVPPPGPAVSHAASAASAKPPTNPHEYVCSPCERGQCARCRDQACNCCYGNEN